MRAKSQKIRLQFWEVSVIEGRGDRWAGDSSPVGYKTQVFWEKIAKNRLVPPQRKPGLAFLSNQRLWDYRHAPDSVRIAPPREYWRIVAEPGSAGNRARYPKIQD